ncbi:MAG: hypothetical protein ACYTGN_12530 [Planctomycetota bacterium]
MAKHETTHLLNHLMRKQLAIKTPSWFEEGAATYFSMFVATGGKADMEPEDHPGALAQVVGGIETGAALSSRELRGVGYAAFLGRQYSWGWALIRFCRRHKNGRRWPELLKYLRTVSGGGGVTDSEERRFLKAVGFKSSDAFDDAWHKHLKGAKPAGGRAPIGTSEQVLARVASIKKPDPKLARNFARIGISLARARVSGPAIVYLRAALRGGVADPEVPFLLATALSEKERLTEDDRWPDEALAALRAAVRTAPLRSRYRLAQRPPAPGALRRACRVQHARPGARAREPGRRRRGARDGAGACGHDADAGHRTEPRRGRAGRRPYRPRRARCASRSSTTCRRARSGTCCSANSSAARRPGPRRWNSSGCWPGCTRRATASSRRRSCTARCSRRTRPRCTCGRTASSA